MNKIFDLIEKEKQRQEEQIMLIASENFVSENVLAAQGSILTNKYAEGYPGKRYYGGCENVDEIETIAIDLLKEMFGAEHANVQPHSGSSANMAVYLAALEPGDTVLGMDLNSGGHLTHGHKLSSSGILYNFIPYSVCRDTHLIDYAKIRFLALTHRPKLIVAGASAYSRIIDFKKFKEIADEVGALLMVDMAHIAGLVACGLHPSPVPYADFVTSTTHKTMRGPRGGFILCKKEWAKKIDRAVFPGIQGGPLMHVIAAKAVAFEELMHVSGESYMSCVVDNMKAMEEVFHDHDVIMVTGGTDNHLLLIDTIASFGKPGSECEALLEARNIIVNKNTIPYDELPPAKGSGIRIGTAAYTAQGATPENCRNLARKIIRILS